MVREMTPFCMTRVISLINNYSTVNITLMIRKALNSKINYSDLLASLIIYLFTFPAFQPTFSIGLDASYVWALNYLFVNDYATLKELIYPYGPLAFLKNPLVQGNNFTYFIIFFSTLKIWFIYLFIGISEQFNKRKVLSYFLVTIMVMVFTIDFLIIGMVFIYSFLFINSKKLLHLFIASTIASIGLYIKSSIGVSAFSILFVALIINYLADKSKTSIFTSLGVVFGCILVCGLIVFHSIEHLFNYFHNIINFSIGYSSALSLFPINNWFLIGISIVSLFLPLLWSRKNQTKYIVFLLLPCLFATWKHAMGRQDIPHSMILYTFLFLYWGAFIALSKVNIKVLLLLASISLLTFYSNLQASWDFSPRKVEINGIVNFEKTILNAKEFESRFKKRSEKNIQNSRLGQEVIDIIGQSTIDSYPWELSYFAANKELNWKPRRTLQ
ncbi:MAG: hypothetical protein WD530_04800, partial [Vicingaceae bacterium]